MCTEPSKPEEYSVLNNFQSYKIPGSILTKWPKLDEIQNDLQVIIDIANFTRVIDVETDVQTEYEEVELEKNENCGGGMGMLLIILYLL